MKTKFSNLLIYLNVQSLFSNYLSLRLLIEECQPIMLFCSETCLTENINDFEIEIENYQLERCDSHSRHTGGVAVYIQNNLNYKVLLNQCYLKNVWCLVLEVRKCELKGIYIVIYHSPNTSDAIFLNFFDDICKQFDDPLKTYIIVGDFNIDMSKATTYSKRLDEIVIDNGLTQMVDYPTRVTASSKTTIDLIITNNINIKTSKIKPKITDHETLEIKLCNKLKPCDNTKTVISWSNYSKELLSEILIRSDWSLFYTIDDINDKLFYVCEILRSAVNLLVSEKTIKCDIKNPWYDNELKVQKQKRTNAYLKANMTDDLYDWADFKIQQNLYKRLIKIKCNKHTQQTIKHALLNKRKLWSCVNKLTKESVREKTYQEITFTNEVISDKDIFASKFNTFFIDSLTEVVTSIPDATYRLNFLPITTRSFTFEVISVEKLSVILKSFKNKSNKGDLITTSVLKDAFSVIGYFICQIINETLRYGEIPKLWKVSTIIPIPKIKNTSHACNFRPINTLPITEKLLECVVKEQFLQYITEAKILCKYQSGFRQNHSCETSLIFVLTNWKNAIDEKHFIIAVFLDFKRAFETIDVNILLKKLYAYGVKDTESKWFSSYLNDRYQRTSFEGHISEDTLVKHGVPQGSVLGPLLFILYINDIHHCIKHGQINLFADDTLLYIKTTDIEDGLNKLNDDLNNLQGWLNENKLKLNINKTKWIVISERQNVVNKTELIVDSEIVERVKCIKYLGVIVDENLKFKEYLDYVKKKVSSKIYLLGRIRNKINWKTALAIYNATIQPCFDYCSSILFQCNKQQIKILQIQQNKALRIILKRRKTQNCKMMISDLNILNVQNRINLNVLCLVFKLKNNLLPSYLSENLLYVHNVYVSMTLRNSLDFRLPKYNKKSTQQNLFYKGLKQYNELPIEVKKSENLNTFKEKATKYLKSTQNS